MALEVPYRDGEHHASSRATITLPLERISFLSHRLTPWYRSSLQRWWLLSSQNSPPVMGYEGWLQRTKEAAIGPYPKTSESRLLYVPTLFRLTTDNAANLCKSASSIQMKRMKTRLVIVF